MDKLKILKDRIMERYDSESAFARDLNWPRQKLNRFTNGTRTPDLIDAKQMAEKLDVPIADMIGFFIPEE